MNDTFEPMRPIGGPEPYYMYYGDRPDWLVMLTVTRDSELVERSNWRVILDDMTERFDTDVTVERSGHWLCGWIDKLIVNPANTDAVKAANVWHSKLADYPLASDDDYYELCHDEAQDTISTVAHDADRYGHDVPPSELSEWDMTGAGDYYVYTCARCGQDIELADDGHTWNVPTECVTDDEE